VAEVAIAPVVIRSPLVVGEQRPLPGETAWPPAPIKLEQPPACRHQRSLTTIVLDGSGSVTAMNGNDPMGRRFEETALALTHMSRTCRCGQELAAVVHFDPGVCDRGPEPLDRRGLRVLADALVVPPGGTSSLLGPSLDVAERLGASHPDHGHVVVVMSDFLLFDPDVGGVLDRLGRFPGRVHTVVLGTEPPDQLVTDNRIMIARIRWDSPPGEVARAVALALAAPRSRL